ncbi:hypothetical protein RclHR1_15470004 [Rhizophagus clarus]|uniref:Uncharacterized protein n=1 Tax=Rhizophagus clarus TaxID=94130 RepID=A0A2Z6QSL4_9GLOM|nr:hypothetical protein RclHR1_15470004 [Rhizophagus clarus]
MWLCTRKRKKVVEDTDNSSSNDNNSTEDEVEWADNKIEDEAEQIFSVLMKSMETLKMSQRPLVQENLNDEMQDINIHDDEEVNGKNNDQSIKYASFINQIEDKLKIKINKKNLSLWLFSTSSIEKKNHNQVRLFFGGTTMGGGIKGKSVVHDIMEFENRQLYYLINNTPQEIQMRNINAEDKENKDP